MKTSELLKLVQDAAQYHELVSTRVRSAVGEVFRLRRRLAVVRARGLPPRAGRVSSGSPAPGDVSERAQRIAEQVRGIRLGDVEASVARFASAIVDLVDEATRGAPRPVNPPLADQHAFPWSGDGWAICGEEPEVGPRPLVVFFGPSARKDAARELQRRQALDPNDVEHLSDEACVLHAQAALSVWNSLDLDPRPPADALPPPCEVCGGYGCVEPALEPCLACGGRKRPPADALPEHDAVSHDGEHVDLLRGGRKVATVSVEKYNRRAALRTNLGTTTAAERRVDGGTVVTVRHVPGPGGFGSPGGG